MKHSFPKDWVVVPWAPEYGTKVIRRYGRESIVENLAGWRRVSEDWSSPVSEVQPWFKDWFAYLPEPNLVWMPLAEWETHMDQKLNTAQAATYIGVTKGTLEVWRCTRRPWRPLANYVGRKVWYSKADLDKYLAERREIL